MYSQNAKQHRLEAAWPASGRSRQSQHLCSSLSIASAFFLGSRHLVQHRYVSRAGCSVKWSRWPPLFPKLYHPWCEMSPVTPWAWPLAVLHAGDPSLPQQPASILWEPPVVCLSEPSAGHSRGTSPPLLRAITGLLVFPKQRPGRTWGELSLGQLWPLGLWWEKHLRMPLEGGLSSHLQNLFPPPQKSHTLSNTVLLCHHRRY